jgi:hypothetical protein
MLNREGLAMPEPEYSGKQVGIIGGREPELCAVSGRPIRGKHAVAHYKGDNLHYVRVLNQYDHRWPEAAPRYGFPVHEEISAQDENVFVLEGLDEPKDFDPEQVVMTDDNGLKSSFLVQTRAPRAPKPATSTQSDIKADGMSKGDD